MEAVRIFPEAPRPAPGDDRRVPLDEPRPRGQPALPINQAVDIL
jgi:hypothetical protein